MTRTKRLTSAQCRLLGLTHGSGTFFVPARSPHWAAGRRRTLKTLRRRRLVRCTMQRKGGLAGQRCVATSRGRALYYTC